MPFSEKGLVLITLDGRIAFASTYFCDLVGVKHDEVAGMSCFDFVFTEELDITKRLFETSKLPNAAPFELRLRRKDGTPVWMGVQTSAMKTASGEVYAITATVTAAEQSLTQSEK